MPIWTGVWCYGTSGHRIRSGFTGYSAGGGLSIPYQQGEEAVDTDIIMVCGMPRVSKSPAIWATRETGN